MTDTFDLRPDTCLRLQRTTLPVGTVLEPRPLSYMLIPHAGFTGQWCPDCGHAVEFLVLRTQYRYGYGCVKCRKVCAPILDIAHSPNSTSTLDGLTDEDWSTYVYTTPAYHALSLDSPFLHETTAPLAGYELPLKLLPQYGRYYKDYPWIIKDLVISLKPRKLFIPYDPSFMAREPGLAAYYAASYFTSLDRLLRTHKQPPVFMPLELAVEVIVMADYLKNIPKIAKHGNKVLLLAERTLQYEERRYGTLLKAMIR